MKTVKNVTKKIISIGDFSNHLLLNYLSEHQNAEKLSRISYDFIDLEENNENYKHLNPTNLLFVDVDTRIAFNLADKKQQNTHLTFKNKLKERLIDYSEVTIIFDPEQSLLKEVYSNILSLLDELAIRYSLMFLGYEITLNTLEKTNSAKTYYMNYAYSNKNSYSLNDLKKNTTKEFRKYMNLLLL